MGYFACLDVHYEADDANACAVVFASGPPERIIAEYCQAITQAEEYVPGEFYKRELPSLLAVFGQIREQIDLILIDGYVWLGNGRKGLGWYLFEELSGKIPVIGVAKSYFAGASGYATVYRGTSSKPLYVTSIGMDLDTAALLISSMGGSHRIPHILKRVDQLTRERDGSRNNIHRPLDGRQ